MRSLWVFLACSFARLTSSFFTWHVQATNTPTREHPSTWGKRTPAAARANTGIGTCSSHFFSYAVRVSGMSLNDGVAAPASSISLHTEKEEEEGAHGHTRDRKKDRKRSTCALSHRASIIVFASVGGVTRGWLGVQRCCDSAALVLTRHQRALSQMQRPSRCSSSFSCHGRFCVNDGRHTYIFKPAPLFRHALLLELCARRPDAGVESARARPTPMNECACAGARAVTAIVHGAPPPHGPGPRCCQPHPDTRRKCPGTRTDTARRPWAPAGGEAHGDASPPADAGQG